jgi:UPF0755 protein
MSGERPVWPRLRFWKFIASIYLYVWAGLGLVAVASGLAAFLVYDHVTQPGPEGPKIRFEVPEGATGQEVGRLLREAGLIEHEAFFRLALRLDGSNTPIRHGVYDLPRGHSALQLLHRLHEAPARQLVVDDYKLTVPEGLSLAQMAELFENPQAFLAAVEDPAWKARLPFEAPSLEGFLMPDTYFFSQVPSPQDAIGRMLDEFNARWARLMAEYPDAAAQDPVALVTLASLIEEEARADEERPLVAAVLYNRIARDMPLQMDSTLQYALGKYGQRMLEADKQVDSPFNTYMYAGLPPGPISNPGLASLRAALSPASVDYLYFVSNADGRTHTFSATYEEHQRAVARYRREIAEQRRQLQAQ